MTERDSERGRQLQSVTSGNRSSAHGTEQGMGKWIVLSVVSLGTFMSTLNASIVNISLPTLANDFGVGISDVEWVVVAFLLATGALLLTFGRLGDIVGYKWVYMVGFVIFTLAGALCGLSQSMVELIGLRVVQGVGAGMIQAIGPAIVTATFSPQERGKALGLNAMSVAVGLALGPTLGGILTEWLSWRWIFFVNLPVGIFGILWAQRVLSDRSGGDSRQRRFDPLGATLASGALLALLLALSEGSSWGWGSFGTIGLLASFALLGAIFVVVELRVRQPMLDLNLFTIRSFSAGNTSLLIAFAALFAANFLLPFFLERGQGLSDLESGLLLTPLPLAILLIAPLSGALSDRIGTRILSAVGLVVLAAGLLSLTSIDAETSPWGLIWRFAVVGTGIGLFNSPNQSSIMGSVARPRLGNASGMIAQMRYTGQALGIAVGGAVVASRTPVHLQDLAGSLPPSQIEREAFILAMHDAFYVAVAVCTVGIVASLIRDRREAGSTPRPSRSLSGEDQLLAGIALAYLTHRIRTSDGYSSNLVRAASRMVKSNGEDSRRDLALRASDEVLSPLSQRLLLNYLRDRENLPEKAVLERQKRANTVD